VSEGVGRVVCIRHCAADAFLDLIASLLVRITL
jgi:hypothetical protein